MLLAAWAGLEALRTPSLGRTVVFGIALGAAELTKFSALSLYPSLAILATIASWQQPGARWRSWAVFGSATALSIVVIDVASLGQGVGQPLLAHPLRTPGMQALAKTIVGRLPLPFPTDLVSGYDEQRREASGMYPVYFHGSWSDHGWWWYFLAAFALKETLALLALLATGTLLVARRRTLDALTTAFLFLPPLVFTALLI